MKTASALVTGNSPEPRLAAEAVDQALAQAGLAQAAGVLLILGPAFARHAPAALLAAARRAGCLQVSGMVAPGCFTEAGWSLEQPAAAALVLGDGAALAGADSTGTPLIFAGTPTLSTDLQAGPPGHGVLQPDAPVWQLGRMADKATSLSLLTGARCTAAHSLGLQPLGGELVVDAVRFYDLQRIDGRSAVDSLARALPVSLRNGDAPPLHQVCLLREAGGPPIAIVARATDGALTLAEPVTPGEKLLWAARQPMAAERNLTEALERAAQAMPRPEFALMFSCIGRGPLFYGGEDRDCLAFRRRFPGVPLLGVYGSSQIHPFAGNSRLYQNSALTLLFESDHVQSLP